MRQSSVIGVALVVFLGAASHAAAHGGGSEGLADHWWDAWAFSPFQIVPTAIVAALYAVRARKLGSRLPIWRRMCFYSGLLLFLVAIMSPIDAVGEDGLFAVHMFQHAIIGGFAPVLVVLGLTGPVLQPILKFHWVQRLSILAHPLIALPLWMATLVFWHVPVIYEFGIENDIAHAIEHGMFFGTSVLLWFPILEPLPAPEWFGTGAKLIYLGILWFSGVVFVNFLWFSGTVLYDRYAETAPEWGVSALQDQGNAGTVFMAEHLLLTLSALVIYGFKFASESAARQKLIEAGLDREAVARAVRHGRADALAKRAGVTLKTRPGID